MEEILLNVESKEIRYAFLKNGLLSDFVIERRKTRQLAGNIYRGKVTNILQNIQSAFIDIDEGESGFIHISDIIENSQKFQEMFDLDFDLDFNALATKTGASKKETDIRKVFKSGQPVLVQVVKDPIGSKGARLTSSVSIPGRYLVLLPNIPHRGVSRKIEDRKARDHLKQLIRSFEMPQDMGLICRTASLEVSPEVLVQEAHDLLKMWQEIMERFEKATGPTCLYEESDLIKRSILTAVDRKISRILVDDQATYQRCKTLYQKYSQEHPLKIELYRDKLPMFERFGVEREIEKALKRKVWLQSGGYLYFDRTEAMYTIDVNSGRSKQNKGAVNVEESLVKINMEAAVEIARQLRLRNVGGLIICDFIDMKSRKNQRRVLEKLKDAMKEDSAKCTILAMSEFGLVEMTRQRNRESLTQTLCTSCPYCTGSGLVKTEESVVVEIERTLRKLISQQHYALKLTAHPLVDSYLNKGEKTTLRKLAEKLNADLKFDSDDTLHLNDFRFHSTLNGENLEF